MAGLFLERKSRAWSPAFRQIDESIEKVVIYV